MSPAVLKRGFFMRLRTPAAVLFAAAISCALPGMTARAEDAGKHGWVTENGRRYYYGEDGTALTGEQVIDGIAYLFAPNGAQQTGWQTVDGKRFYYDRSGEAQFGWVSWRGGEYFIDAQAGKQTGKTETDEGIYQLDFYGALQTGWIHTGENSWRYAGESAMLSVGEVLIDGQPYLFDEEGDLKTGWQTPSDGIKRHYDPETAQIGKGFVRDAEAGTVCYVADDFTLLTGLQELNGKRYFFGSDGVMQTGFQTVGSDTYYFDPEDGDAWRGMHKIDGDTYLFDSETCIRLTGLAETGSVRRCFDADGKMLTESWYETDTDRYYFDADGIGTVGMLELDGSTYAFDRGRMLCGFMTYPSGTRLFLADGKMAVGRTEYDGAWYVFGEDGIRLTGWQETDGVSRWYSEETGKMAAGRAVIDGETWIFDGDGLPLTGAYTAPDGKQYYCETAGKPVTGWYAHDGKTRHYGENGAMTVSASVDGYVIDASGNARTQNAVTADALVKENGVKPTVLFTAFTGRYRYSRMEATRPYETLRSAGWEKLITYLFENRKGVCYYLAAGFDFVCQRAGLETRIVHTNHDTGDHYWVQVKVNGAWQNYDPTYKARNNIGWNEIIKLGKYNVLGFITVTYDDRGTIIKETYQKNS